MRQRQQVQQLDRRDPIVAQFVAECGLIEHPVGIRLSADDRADLIAHKERLERTFASMITFSQPRLGRDERTWYMYGTFLG
jgi:hypothetical protein